MKVYVVFYEDMLDIGYRAIKRVFDSHSKAANYIVTHYPYVKYIDEMDRYVFSGEHYFIEEWEVE